MRTLPRRLAALSLAVGLAGVAASPNSISASSVSTLSHCGVTELSQFQVAVFYTQDPTWDLNEDGVVNVADLALLQVCIFPHP